MRNGNARIDSRLLLITPELATKWLEGNTHNRPIRDSKVHQYADDMRAGRWGMSHQGIAFSDDDPPVLLDGQHRLWAIIESRCAVEIMVTRGLPIDAQSYIDQGLPRNVVDILKLSDPDANVSSYRVAVARRMHIGTRTQVIMSNQEQIEFLEQHEKAISFVLEQALQGKRPIRVAPAPVAAALGRAYYHEDHAKLVNFGAVLLGLNMAKSDAEKGPHLLREWLIQGSPMYGVRIERALMTYQKAQRAIIAYINGEPLRSLYPMKDEAWPLQGEQRRAKSVMKSGDKAKRAAKAS